MAHDFIPFALPSLGEEEIAAVTETLRSGWITTGPTCARFEEAFARHQGTAHAVAVNSATAGLHLALEGIGVRPGDRVVTTPYTFTATAEVIRYLDADPLFVDVDPATYNIDPVATRRAIEEARGRGERVTALIPVHIAGLACDMAALAALAEEYDIPLVSDAAHAFPARHGQRPLGAAGRATVFSFYANKNITTGEGGMVTTDDGELAARMRLMRLHGIDRDAWRREENPKAHWYYEVVAPGFKYNLTDIAAAIGLAQLAKADAFRARREMIVRRYDEAFADLAPPVERPYDRLPHGRSDRFYADHAWHLYPLRVAEGRDRFIEELAARGIGSSVHFIPLHLQPYWRQRYGLTPDQFPHATALYRAEVSLPLFPAMTDVMVERVAAAVRELAR
ncbi:MAG: DegT/DnrJ/EryC1/StrS aminotransferase family protein [Nitrospinae bacterium]|nr:DegT/DnrJ/EryC1/StrS aminotransferase family protein [Nitrospinota bacterium]